MPSELDAAAAAGMLVALVRRPGNLPAAAADVERFTVLTDFGALFEMGLGADVGAGAGARPV